MAKKIKEFLYEKFNENTDPIEDLNIGMVSITKKELEKLLEDLQDMWDKKYEEMFDNSIDRSSNLDLIEKFQDMINELSVMKEDENS
jgi:hypothetical protein